MQARAILFDLDGVLVDSRQCVELVWRTWAGQRGLDAAPFLAVAHGRRISETFRLVRPDLDAATEARVLDAMEEVETRGLDVVPGAAALLASLGVPQWGIVTSGSVTVASLRLRAGGIAAPPVFVTAGDVRRGKPDPEGYLLGARRLGLEPRDCLVIEDAPPGVAAGKAAGMRVIALLTTHRPEQLADADARVPSLADLRVAAGPAGVTVDC